MIIFLGSQSTNDHIRLTGYVWAREAESEGFQAIIGVLITEVVRQVKLETNIEYPLIFPSARRIRAEQSPSWLGTWRSVWFETSALCLVCGDNPSLSKRCGDKDADRLRRSTKVNIECWPWPVIALPRLLVVSANMLQKVAMIACCKTLSNHSPMLAWSDYNWGGCDIAGHSAPLPVGKESYNRKRDCRLIIIAGNDRQGWVCPRQQMLREDRYASRMRLSSPSCRNKSNLLAISVSFWLRLTAEPPRSALLFSSSAHNLGWAKAHG